MIVDMPSPPIAWSPEYTATGDPRIPAVVWRPCIHCWGQGRIYARNLRDWDHCDRCVGVGSVPA